MVGKAEQSPHNGEETLNRCRSPTNANCKKCGQRGSLKEQK